MVKKSHLIFYFLLAAPFLALAQDTHYSMYDMSPMVLNAAETGVHDGDWRAGIHFRQQWKAIAQPYRTVSAGYDQNIYALPGNFSAGLFFLTDRSGVIDLTHNRTYLSLGYKIIRTSWTFSLGVQAGYVLKSYNLSGTTFPEQYNDNIGSFDPGMPLSERNLGNQTGYFDLNLGAVAQRRFDNAELHMGFSVMHVNSPNVSYFDNKEHLPERHTGYARFQQNVGSEMFVRPSLMVSVHQKAQEILVGSDVGMYFAEAGNVVRSAYVGIDMRNGFDRNGDAFIVSAGFTYGDFLFGLAYDINYSTLDRATNNRGAFEMSVIYISPSTAIKRITIPCDRY